MQLVNQGTFNILSEERLTCTNTWLTLKQNEKNSNSWTFLNGVFLLCILLY